jgi:O-antigen/teichoic acid export membrane protein
MSQDAQKQRIGRNVLVTLITQLISWGLTFAVTLYLPRYVGDSGLGKLTFAASFVAVFGVVVPLGTSLMLVKEIARDRSRTGELLMAALAVRIPLSILMTALAVLFAFLLGYTAVMQALILVAALGMIVGTLNDAFGAVLQGQENLTRQNAGVLINKFLTSALTIFLILRHAPLWALAAIGIWTGIVSLLVNASAFRVLLPTLRVPRLETIKTLALAGLPFMGWTVFQTLYGQTDPIVLKFVANDQTVGWYAAAFRLVCTTLFLPTALTTALLPTLSRLHHENQADFRQLARRMLGLVMLCGVPISLVLILLPDRLVSLLHYPAGFQHSIPVLRVGGVGVLLWFAGNALGTTIFALDGQARMFRASMMSSLIGIPGCFLCSFVAHHFWHNGAVGAIASDVLLEMYLVWTYLRLLPQDTFDVESLRGIGRCVMASLPMAALLAFLSAFGWGLWSLLPCVLVYAAMCFWLGCLKPQDLAMARQVFVRKRG